MSIANGTEEVARDRDLVMRVEEETDLPIIISNLKSYYVDMNEHGRACLTSFDADVFEDTATAPMPIAPVIILMPDSNANLVSPHSDRSVLAVLCQLDETWKVDVICPNLHHKSSYIRSEWTKENIKREIVCPPVFKVLYVNTVEAT